MNITQVDASVFNSLPSSYENGVYTKADLTTTWVDLVSADFKSLGTYGACDASMNFTEITAINNSAAAQVLYLITRAHNAAPEDISRAIPIPAGGQVVFPCGMSNKGGPINTVAIIGSAAATSIVLIARFAK